MKFLKPKKVRLAKTAKQMERHVKGIANHHRINILLIIADNPDISVEQIADKAKGNYKTISQHIRRLTLAGLVDKKYKGQVVCHKLSPYGKVFHAFITSFSYS